QRAGVRRLADGQRLAEDGDGPGVADPGRFTAGVGNLPAVVDQPAPAAVDADLPGFLALTADHDALVRVVTLAAIAHSGDLLPCGAAPSILPGAARHITPERTPAPPVPRRLRDSGSGAGGTGRRRRGARTWRAAGSDRATRPGCGSRSRGP